jgi:hypothetical protein
VHTWCNHIASGLNLFLHIKIIYRLVNTVNTVILSSSQYPPCDLYSRPGDHMIPQGSVLSPLLYIMCINIFPLRINFVSEPMYADDTSVVISSRNLEDFCSVSNLVVSFMVVNGFLLII